MFLFFLLLLMFCIISFQIQTVVPFRQEHSHLVGEGMLIDDLFMKGNVSQLSQNIFLNPQTHKQYYWNLKHQRNITNPTLVLRGTQMCHMVENDSCRRCGVMDQLGYQCLSACTYISFFCVSLPLELKSWLGIWTRSLC